MTDTELQPMAPFQGIGHFISGYYFKPHLLADRPIASVLTRNEGEELVFAFVDGSTATFTAQGDCCSRSWVEHLTVPSDIAGAVVTHVAENEMGETWNDPDHYECVRVYQTTFRTAKGDIVVEYRNESNGYYGGWLEGPVIAVPA